MNYKMVKLKIPLRVQHYDSFYQPITTCDQSSLVGELFGVILSASSCLGRIPLAVLSLNRAITAKLHSSDIRRELYHLLCFPAPYH